MRLIGSLPTAQAKKFSQFLDREKVENDCENTVGREGKEVGLIWITSEDDVEKSTKWFTQFQNNPNDPFFETVSPYIEKPIIPRVLPPPGPGSLLKKRARAPFITLLIILCTLIFLVTEWTAPPAPESIEKIDVPMAFAPPIMKDLLYDYPYTYELADKIYQSFTIEQVQNPSKGPKELQELLTKLRSTPYWRGLYDEFLESAKEKKEEWHYSGPMFEKIQKGEYWRTFTPCLLHGNLLHILFNLMWIVVLGYQIERKIGTLKTILFVLITGIFSNTCQYLMSGPNFLGISGVVVAMAGFIYMRQKRAPWEGYLLHSSTVLFLAIFVFAMFVVQSVSFFLELYSNSSFSPGIANTAHIAGGVFGIFLGSFKIFAKKLHHHKH